MGSMRRGTAAILCGISMLVAGGCASGGDDRPTDTERTRTNTAGPPPPGSVVASAVVTAGDADPHPLLDRLAARLRDVGADVVDSRVDGRRVWLVLSGVGERVARTAFDAGGAATRPVLASAPGVCEEPAVEAAPERPMAACDATERFELGPQIVGPGDVRSATAQLSQANGWVVTVTHTDAAAERWRDYTGRHPGRRTALVSDGAVVSAPIINAMILGPMEIAGRFDRDGAQTLALRLSGDPGVTPFADITVERTRPLDR